MPAALSHRNKTPTAPVILPASTDEAQILITADAVLDDAKNGTLTRVQAIYELGDLGSRFVKNHTAEVTTSPFLRRVLGRIVTAQTTVVAEALSRDPNLIHQDYQRQSFDARLADLFTGPNSIEANLRYYELMAGIERVISAAIHGSVNWSNAFKEIAESAKQYNITYPQTAAAMPLYQGWNASLQQTYDSIILPRLATDPHFTTIDGRTTFSGYLAGASDNSLLSFINSERARFEVLDIDVVKQWDPSAVRFHRENKGQCGAGGGCPSHNCGIRDIKQALASQGRIWGSQGIK